MSLSRGGLRMTRSTLLLAVVAIIVSVMTFAVSRAVTTTPPPAIGTTARPAPRPTRPALTPAEESYVRAMWPIHGDVERSVMRASLGQILYKTDDLSRAELKARMTQA